MRASSRARPIRAAAVAVGRPAVHAHRGAPLVFPENTLAGFRHAIEAGADFIELDLGVSSDAKLVVSHDPWLKPDRMPLRSATADEARRRGCPLLDDVLALASPGEFGFNLEIKSFPDHPEYTPPPEELAAMVAESVRACGLGARCLIQSFDPRVTRAMKRVAPELPRAALWESEPRGAASIATEADAQAVSIAWRLAGAEWLEDARAQGIGTLVWTVNGARGWAEALAYGAGAIITDDAVGLIAFLRARGL